MVAALISHEHGGGMERPKEFLLTIEGKNRLRNLIEGSGLLGSESDESRFERLAQAAGIADSENFIERIFEGTCTHFYDSDVQTLRKLLRFFRTDIKFINGNQCRDGAD